MTKVIPAVIALMVLGACTNAQKAVNKGPNDWAYVGCHVVTQNPSPTGEYAVTPFPHLEMRVGERIYWKQRSKDGSPGLVTTGVPCKD